METRASMTHTHTRAGIYIYIRSDGNTAKAPSESDFPRCGGGGEKKRKIGDVLRGR